MKIVLDAMGGDHAPYVTVEGAVKAVKETDDIEVVLIGQEGQIAEELRHKHYPHERISIRHASEIISMTDHISTAIRRKKDSSIRRGIEMVKQGEADAFVSAGHSGAVMALALLILKTAEGVARPAIAATMPTLKGLFVLIDAGANVDSGPESLHQFAHMGSAYSKYIHGIESPRVGLLSIGEEDVKGNELTKEAFRLLQDSALNFIGNVEGKDIFKGDIDVVVCDGFMGNNVLKVSEGLAEAFLEMMKQEIAGSFMAKIGFLLMRPALKNFKKRTDYDEYGGAPLLGLNGTCIISHGRSTPKAIKNAIKVASRFARQKVNQIVSNELKKNNRSHKSEKLVSNDKG
jgi:glycerol-3-phosphate acyltransferase PlsX